MHRGPYKDMMKLITTKDFRQIFQKQPSSTDFQLDLGSEVMKVFLKILAFELYLLAYQLVI